MRNDRLIAVLAALFLVAGTVAMAAAPFLLTPPVDVSMLEAAPVVTPVPEPSAENGAAIAGLVLRAIEAFRSSKGAAGAGFALMTLVWAARKLAPRWVPKQYLGTAVLGLTALGGFAAALAAGLPVLDSALTTLLLGAAAIGFWEGLGKAVSEWLGDKGPGAH